MTDLHETSRRLAELNLTHATLLVDEARARRNIRRFVTRAHAAGISLRPHFKTHQSADVAAWFREDGVDRATVSSLGQACYFADHGWRDLTLAIGLNPREMDDLTELAGRIRLGVTVDHPAQVEALATAAPTPLEVWLEVDVGYGRAGVPHQNHRRLAELAVAVEAHGHLICRGLLTHAGHSYGGDSELATRVFHDAHHGLATLRRVLERPELLISAGDTPGFMAVENWSGIDEARPGNFVFFDLMQHAAGVCTDTDLACAVACPVIGVYPERRQAVVHAGAVHLGKEALDTPDGPVHGRLLTMSRHGFGKLTADGVVTGLSQEHGTVTFDSEKQTAALTPGDLLLVLPVHSCLTCEQFAAYRTTDGHQLQRYARI